MAATTTRQYTKEQAEIIALKGVDRCYKQGYTYESIPGHPDHFFVVKPGGQERYRVIIADGGKGEYAYCDCPFCDYGYNHHTCKHIAFLRDNLEAMEWVAFRGLVHECMEHIRHEEEADAKERYGFRSGVIVG